MTHPLERLKRIADETIRKQAIENFSQEYYNKEISWGSNDEDTISSAICLSFEWETTPQGFEYWCSIEDKAINNQLELLPEEPSEPTIEQIIKNTKEPINGGNVFDELEKVKLENEKLRECLKNIIDCTRKSGNGRNRLNDNKLGRFHENITQAKQLLNQK